VDPNLIKVRRVSHRLGERIVVCCQGVELGVIDQAGLKPVQTEEYLQEEDSQIEITRLVWLGDLLSERASIETTTEQPLELGKQGERGHEP
jgi:hypothetical protein